jgi:hypothetical protein
MRMFALVADFAMGAILGVFLYVALSRTWPALQHQLVLALVLLASVAVVLVRRPGGSLATWWQRRSDR